MAQSRIVTHMEVLPGTEYRTVICVEEIDGGDGGYRVFVAGGVLGNGDDERIHDMVGDAMADAAEEASSIVSECH